MLACQPTAAETTLSFAALGDLLSAALPEILPGLPPAQRRAVEVALALGSGEGPAVDDRVLGLALLSALRLLALLGVHSRTGLALLLTSQQPGHE